MQNDNSSLKLKDIPFRYNLKLKASNTDLKVNRVNSIAERLAQTYDNQSFIPFFRKVAWHKSEDFIWSLVERSKSPKVKNSLYYFVAVAKSEL